MPKIHVLVIYKRSAYSRYLSSKAPLKNLKSGDYWKVVMRSHHWNGQTLKGVLGILKRHKLEVTLVQRERLGFLKEVEPRYHLAVPVGGDGTLLEAAHYLRKMPILGVNSDPERSVGRFSACELKTFPEVIKGYLDGRITSVPVHRLEFLLNGRKSRWLVLNDILVTTLSPAGTSRYILKIGSRVEEQMSSGVWISTAAGSTAATYSAGGRVLPVLSRKFQFVVREPYQKKFGPRRLLKGVLEPAQELEMVSNMREGRLFIDGANLSAPFGLGDRLKIRASRQPIKIIGLKIKAN